MVKKFLCNDERINNWLNMHLSSFLKKGGVISDQEIEHIIDYLKSDDSPKRIARLGVIQAKEQSIAWTELINKRSKKKLSSNFTESFTKDVSTIKKYENGYFWVKLESESSYQKEGQLMEHCVATYSDKSDSIIYSLRDNLNNPHCTIEKIESLNSINQIKGKKNSLISEKYIPFVIDFLNSMNLQEVHVKPYDLVNLNAFFVIRNGIKVISKIKDLQEEDVFLNEVKFSKIEEVDSLPKKLYFKKLIVMDSDLKKESLKDWTLESLVLINSKLQTNELNIKYLETFKSKLKINNLKVHSFLFEGSNLDIKEIHAEIGKVNKESFLKSNIIKVDDLVLSKSNITNADCKITSSYVSIEDFDQKTIFEKIFKNMKIGEFLELKGSFKKDLKFPDLNLSTLSINHTDIKKIPSNVSSKKIFYTDETVLIEGLINEKFKG